MNNPYQSNDPYGGLGSVLGQLLGPSCQQSSAYQNSLNLLAQQNVSAQMQALAANDPLYLPMVQGMQNTYSSSIDPLRLRAEQEVNGWYKEWGYELPFPASGLGENE